MLVYKVHLVNFNGPTVYKDIQNALDEVKELLLGSDPGEQILVEKGEMTEQEYNNLPEFEGY